MSSLPTFSPQSECMRPRDTENVLHATKPAPVQPLQCCAFQFPRRVRHTACSTATPHSSAAQGTSTQRAAMPNAKAGRGPPLDDEYMLYTYSEAIRWARAGSASCRPGQRQRVPV